MLSWKIRGVCLCEHYLRQEACSGFVLILLEGKEAINVA